MIESINKNEFLKSVDAAIDRLMRKRELSAANVAESLSMHPQKLQRQMKSLVGMSSSEYITHYRLDLAKRLLIENDMQTIATIGYQCGFEEPTHFNRFFKRLTGMTPREFRQL